MLMMMDDLAPSDDDDVDDDVGDLNVRRLTIAIEDCAPEDEKYRNALVWARIFMTLTWAAIPVVWCRFGTSMPLLCNTGMHTNMRGSDPRHAGQVSCPFPAPCSLKRYQAKFEAWN